MLLSPLFIQSQGPLIISCGPLEYNTIFDFLHSRTLYLTKTLHLLLYISSWKQVKVLNNILKHGEYFLLSRLLLQHNHGTKSSIPPNQHFYPRVQLVCTVSTWSVLDHFTITCKWDKSDQMWYSIKGTRNNLNSILTTVDHLKTNWQPMHFPYGQSFL